MEKSDIINAHEEDAKHFCACGEEKNPDFAKCFVCTKAENKELDIWISNLQHATKKWDQEPF